MYLDPSLWIPIEYDQDVNLQATVSAATAMASSESYVGLKGLHHPITCGTEIALYEDGSMRCDHATSSPDNLRNQDCINASIAILLFELVHQKYGSNA